MKTPMVLLGVVTVTLVVAVYWLFSKSFLLTTKKKGKGQTSSRSANPKIERGKDGYILRSLQNRKHRRP